MYRHELRPIPETQSTISDAYSRPYLRVLFYYY